MKVQEEQIVIDRLLQGEKEALEYFFYKYYNDLCNFINFYVRSQDISEDLAQDIYVWIWENRSNLSNLPSFRNYLFTSGKNRALNYLRNNKTSEKVRKEVVSRSSLIESAPVDRNLEVDEMQRIIQGAIARLPEKCGKIYQLSREEGLTNKEIAENLGLSIKTVENQMGIALKKLRKDLQPYYEQFFVLFLLSLFN